MEYREFGKTGVKVSILGFGAMRLPMYEDNGKQLVREEESLKMIIRSFELGINYIDTAFTYCYEQSETIVGKALKIWRNRNKNSGIYIATKLPTWKITKSSDFWFYLEKQLTRLDVERIDFYHFHHLTEDSFEEKIIKLNIINEARKARDQNMIRHISFSFHDSPEILKKIIDTGFFETVLCQYNILDQSNSEAIEYAHSKGLGVAIMGPLGGGRIKDVEFFKQELGNKKSHINELALKFVFSNKNISVALSGMENIEMVEENLKTANGIYTLTKKESTIIDKFLSQKEVGELIPCTNCKYCLPCPNSVSIPKILKLMNYYTITGLRENARWQYRDIVIDNKGNLADSCTECGECEEKCPQGIKIMDKLKESHKALN